MGFKLFLEFSQNVMCSYFYGSISEHTLCKGSGYIVTATSQSNFDDIVWNFIDTFFDELFSRSFTHTWIPAVSQYYSCKIGIVWWSNCIGLVLWNDFSWASAPLMQELNLSMRNVFIILSVKTNTFFFSELLHY